MSGVFLFCIANAVRRYFQFGFGYPIPKLIPRYSRNMEVLVNGKKLPFDQGLAHYRKRFDTAGEKRLSVQILVRNPVTQDVESFSKDFWVVVLDSCVQKNNPNTE